MRNLFFKPAANGIVPLLSLNFFMADMQAGIRPFLGVFLLAHHWKSGLIGSVMTIGGVAGMLVTAPGWRVDRHHEAQACVCSGGGYFHGPSIHLALRLTKLLNRRRITDRNRDCGGRKARILADSSYLFPGFAVEEISGGTFHRELGRISSPNIRWVQRRFAECRCAWPSGHESSIIPAG